MCDGTIGATLKHRFGPTQYIVQYNIKLYIIKRKLHVHLEIFYMFAALTHGT